MAPDAASDDARGDVFTHVREAGGGRWGPAHPERVSPRIPPELSLFFRYLRGYHGASSDAGDGPDHVGPVQPAVPTAKTGHQIDVYLLDKSQHQKKRTAEVKDLL